MSHLQVVVRCCNEEHTFAVVRYDTASGEKLDEKELLRRVTSAVARWYKTTNAGRSYEPGDGVFDIVDLEHCQDWLSMQTCLQLDGLHHLRVDIFRDYMSKEWEYDTPLLEY